MPGPLDRPAPPAGEDIHLPEGSLHPLLLTVGITLALVGVTINTGLIVIGLIITVLVLFLWIREARHEFSELPAVHHGPGFHEEDDHDHDHDHDQVVQQH